MIHLMNELIKLKQRHDCLVIDMEKDLQRIDSVLGKCLSLPMNERNLFEIYWMNYSCVKWPDVLERNKKFNKSCVAGEIIEELVTDVIFTTSADDIRFESMMKISVMFASLRTTGNILSHVTIEKIMGFGVLLLEMKKSHEMTDGVNLVRNMITDILKLKELNLTNRWKSRNKSEDSKSIETFDERSKDVSTIIQNLCKEVMIEHRTIMNQFLTKDSVKDAAIDEELTLTRRLWENYDFLKRNQKHVLAFRSKLEKYGYSLEAIKSHEKVFKSKVEKSSNRYKDLSNKFMECLVEETNKHETELKTCCCKYRQSGSTQKLNENEKLYEKKYHNFTIILEKHRKKLKKLQSDASILLQDQFLELTDQIKHNVKPFIQKNVFTIKFYDEMLEEFELDPTMIDQYFQFLHDMLSEMESNLSRILIERCDTRNKRSCQELSKVFDDSNEFVQKMMDCHRLRECEISSVIDNIRKLRTRELEMHHQCFGWFKQEITNAISSMQFLLGRSLLKLELEMESNINNREEFMSHLEFRSLSDTNFLMMKLNVRQFSHKTRLSEISQQGQQSLETKYHSIMEELQYYNDERIKTFDQGGMYHNSEVKMFKRNIDKLIGKLETAHERVVMKLREKTDSLLQEAFQVFNQDMKLIQSLTLEVQTILEVRLIEETFPEQLEFVEKISRTHVSALYKTTHELLNAIRDESHSLGDIQTLIRELWNRIEIYSDFYRFQPVLNQSKGHKIKYTQKDFVVIDPSGEIFEGMNLYKLLKQKLSMSGNVTKSKFDHLYRTKKRLRLQLYHETLVSWTAQKKLEQSMKEMRADIEECLERIITDVIQFMNSLNTFYDAVNEFCHRSIKEMHVRLTHDTLVQEKGGGDTYTHLNKQERYNECISELQNDLQDMLDEYFNNEAFDGVRNKNFIETLELEKIDPLPLSFVIETHMNIFSNIRDTKTTENEHSRSLSTKKTEKPMLSTIKIK